MHTQPRLGRFLRAATTASLLASFAPDTFAQGSGPADPLAGQNAAPAPTYELEITNGHLAGSAKPKANAPAKPATLGNAIDLLRELHPEANFVLAAGLDRSVIADLKLRAASVEDQLEALRIASGSRFAWHTGNSGSVTPGAIDPTTGVPSSSGGKPNPTLYVLAPSAVARPVPQVEAFNIAIYLDSLYANEPKENRAKLIEEQLKRIEEIVESTVQRYNNLSQSVNGTLPKNFEMASIRFHPGANIAVIIGDPESVAVAAKVIGALPGAQRSVASEDPALRPGDPFQGLPGSGGMGMGSGGGGMGSGGGSGRSGGGGGLGAGSMSAGGMSGSGGGGALGGRGTGIGGGGAGGGGGVPNPNRP